MCIMTTCSLPYFLSFLSISKICLVVIPLYANQTTLSRVVGLSHFVDQLHVSHSSQHNQPPCLQAVDFLSIAFSTGACVDILYASASCNTTKFNSLSSSVLIKSGLYITSRPLVQAVGISSVKFTLPTDNTPANIQNCLLRIIAMWDFVTLCSLVSAITILLFNACYTKYCTFTVGVYSKVATYIMPIVWNNRWVYTKPPTFW
jgi:hypothetical protein